jgi:hypothetical protein
VHLAQRMPALRVALRLLLVGVWAMVRASNAGAEGAQGSAETPTVPPPKRDWHFNDAPFDVELRTGFATSVGVLGLVGEYAPIEEITLGAGAGVNPWGGVWGVHARVRGFGIDTRRENRRSAFTLEMAFSRGLYSRVDPFGDVFSAMCEGSPDDPSGGCYRPHVVPAAVSWGQIELGWEVRSRSGFTFRASLGVATALNFPDWGCSVEGKPATCDRAPLPASTIFAQTLAFGYAFGGH